MTWIIEALPGYYFTPRSGVQLLPAWGIGGYGAMPRAGMTFQYSESFTAKTGFANSFQLKAAYYTDPCANGLTKDGPSPPAMYHSIVTGPRPPVGPISKPSGDPISPDGGQSSGQGPGGMPEFGPVDGPPTPGNPSVDCYKRFVPERCLPYYNPDLRTSASLPPPTTVEFVSKNIEFNHSKKGFLAYTHRKVKPKIPKYYLRERTTTRLIGGTPETLVGGIIEQMTCRMTGAVKNTVRIGNPSWYGSGQFDEITDTSQSGSMRVENYDDCPNQREDRPGVLFFWQNLINEYTKELMRNDTFDNAWSFRGNGYYLQQPASAELLIDEHEETISFQKTKYKIRVPVEYPRPYTVNWLEVFTPEDEDPDDEIEPEVIYEAKQATIQGTESGTFTIDPSATPDKEGTWSVFLLPVEVAVDADRDGEITFDGKDKTTFQKPYRFWINDDRDIEDHNATDGGYLEEDDVDSFASDCDQPGLEYRRDLEDLTRLWIDFSGISQVFPVSDPTVALKVRIQSESGDPKFTFFQPVEPDGGKKYLKDEATGSSQLQGSYGQELCRVTGTASVEIPRRAWETLPSDKIVHLLFEGAKEGDAELIFEIWKDGEKVCDLPTVYIVLRKAEDMYETWSVGDVVNEGVDYTKWPASTFSQTTGQDLPSPEKPEEKDYIMFVHGWNMPPWEKETFGSTMFKRMWHQGYKGRFGMFRWPTFHGFEGSFSDLTQDPDHFNASELRAWNSASRLKALIENRASVFGSDKIRLYGHSMGNIVCGEALRQFGSSGAPVHSYIAAQAAISSHVYDKTTPARKPAYQLEMPNVYGYYWQPGASDWPPQWEIDGRPSYMDAQYLPTNVTYINHYNFDDYALNGTRWPLNQDLKPGFNYHYTFQGLVGGYSDYRFIRGPRYSQTILNIPSDRYEIFSNAADSVANSLGKVGSTGGKFIESVNVSPLLVYDSHPEAHKYHSGQFRSTIQKRWEYWEIALDNMDTATPAQ